MIDTQNMIQYIRFELGGIKYMFEIFTTREVASFLWLLIILVFLIYNKEIRSSLKDILKSIFTPKIIIPFLILFVYIITLTYFFSLSSFWKLEYLKDIIISSIFVIIPFVFTSILTNDTKYFIKKYIVNTLKFTIVAEFIVSTYTFNIYIELIIFPILLILTALDSISKYSSEYYIVHKLTSNILVFLGIIILFFSVYKAINNLDTMQLTDLIITFLIPIFLAISNIPFVYFLTLFTLYESAFTNMCLKDSDNNRIRKNHKIKVFKKCKFSHDKISYFKTNIIHMMYTSMSEEEFDKLIELI